MYKVRSVTNCSRRLTIGIFVVLFACDNPEPESRRDLFASDLNSETLVRPKFNQQTKDKLDEISDRTQSQSSTASAQNSSTSTATTVTTSDRPNQISATDEEAIAFIKEQCVSCHDSKVGSVRSFWAIDPETINKAELLTSTMAPTIYYSMLLSSKNIRSAMPAAMPVKKLSPTEQAQLLKVLAWFKQEAPATVVIGQARYGGATPSESDHGAGVLLDYKCEQAATFREYIRRFTNDAFGREPKPAELEMSLNGVDQPVTLADRKKIASMLVNDNDWNKEFTERGLRKFSAKISGSADIQPLNNVLTTAQVRDLKDEFYQLLKANLSSKSFKEILLSKQIQVSANTAALYGCTPPSADEWTACELTPPRDSYFTSFSYLRSKPSSFLVENNNYGRVSLMYFMIRGDVFKAAFDQENDKNDDIITPPACLTSKDQRGTKGTANVAPFGTLAVPKSANSCQSCHIHRNMAAGSILFRNFDKVGHVYTKERPINNDPDFQAALADNIVNSADAREVYIDVQFLQSLLDKKGEQACIPGENGKSDRILQSVGDLAEHLMGTGLELSVGLARHIPRAISNLPNTTEELIISFNDAWQRGGGKLLPLFEAYFASETFACSKRS